MNPREDKIIKRVVEKILQRSEAGYKKYGVGLDKDDQTLDTWLNHLQEELMDAVLYLQKLKEESTVELQEALLNSIQVNEEDAL